MAIIRRATIAAVSLLVIAVTSPRASAQGHPLPAPWQSTDIGDVGTPGYAYETSDGDFVMAAAGADIWGTSDSFRFAYQPVQSDVDVRAELGNESNTSPFAKFGLMVRQSIDPGSPFVIIDVKPDGGVEFMMRATQGGETAFIAGGSVAVTPVPYGVAISKYFTLRRIGSTVTGIVCPSLGSNTCQTIGSVQWLTGPVLAGAAATSHDPSTLNLVGIPAHLPDVMPTAIPSPWHYTDVGDVGVSGSANAQTSYGALPMTVRAGGADIWGTADSFGAVTRPFSGDGVITTLVESEQDTSPFAKAGVVMGSLAPAAARVILDMKPDGGVEFMARLSPGGAMTYLGGAAATFPLWLRLARVGDHVEAATARDGQTWIAIGSVDIPLGDAAEAGVAVTSHDRTVINTAEFAAVEFATSIAPPQNLIVNPGFDASSVPALGPGWVSDSSRQSPAQTETAQPRGGTIDAACRTTGSLDCGIYQDVTAPKTGNYVFRIYAVTDKPGALVGVNVNGAGRSTPVQVGGFYQSYSIGFFANAGDTIRVWAYSPAAPGSLLIDDTWLAPDPSR